MGSYRKPGPVCQITNPVNIDSGTTNRQCSPGPGPVGVITSSQLNKLSVLDETDFMRKVYDEQLQRALKKKEFFAGLPANALAAVEGKYSLRKDAARECSSLLAQARSDLRNKQESKEEQALKVSNIGIVSAYRDPEYDKVAWERAFKKHYTATKQERAKLVGGEYGNEAVQLLAQRLRRFKAVPGFSNHTSGIAVDFTTTENGIVLGPNSSQNDQWKGSWFHKWLVENAGKYRFKPLSTEAWHWDYNGTQRGSSLGAEQNRGQPLTCGTQLASASDT